MPALDRESHRLQCGGGGGASVLYSVGELEDSRRFEQHSVGVTLQVSRGLQLQSLWRFPTAAVS